MAKGVIGNVPAVLREMAGRGYLTMRIDERDELRFGLGEVPPEDEPLYWHFYFFLQALAEERHKGRKQK